jgi:hypothetical protein
VGQQLADRRRPVRGSLSTVRPTHPKVRELGEKATERVIKTDLALLHKDHYRRRGDGLGHRGKAKHVLLANGCGAAHFANAHAAAVNRAAVLDDQHRNPGSAATVNEPPQRLVKFRRARLRRKGQGRGCGVVR